MTLQAGNCCLYCGSHEPSKHIWGDCITQERKLLDINNNLRQVMASWGLATPDNEYPVFLTVLERAIFLQQFLVRIQS